MGLLLVAGAMVVAVVRSQPTAAAGDQCVDLSKDPAGCQPSTFDTPFAQMPSVRVNRKGDLDAFSSEKMPRSVPSKSRSGSICFATSSICTG